MDRRRGFLRQAKRAFSLVELSIVLVILGLLAGGVLSGQALIHASQVRNLVADYQNYQTAIGSFRDKYFALPGDMPNAIDFWGAANSDPVACITTQGTGTQTCNGTGDGKISQVVWTDSYEMFRFWQELANAGLIPGSYTGVAGAASVGDAVPGVNVPMTKFSNVGFNIWYLGNYQDSNEFLGDYGNVMVAGTRLVTGGNPGLIFGPFLTPAEAWSIDIKLDDGKPATGRVWNSKSSSARTPNCTTSDDPITAQYNLTATDTLCNIGFKTGY